MRKIKNIEQPGMLTKGSYAHPHRTIITLATDNETASQLTLHIPSSTTALRGAFPASVQSMVKTAGCVARTPSGFNPEPCMRTLDGSILSSTGTLNGDPKAKYNNKCSSSAFVVEIKSLSKS